MNIPDDPSAITPNWLTHTLRRTGTIKNASIRALDIEPIRERGVASKLARFNLHYDAYEDGSPKSLIAKFPSSSIFFRLLMSALHAYKKEVSFYEKLADKINLRTPRCYYSALDEKSGRFILLLEDLNPAYNGSTQEGCNIEQATLAVEHLANFHSVWWEHSELPKISWLSPPSKAFLFFQYLYRYCWYVFPKKVKRELPNRVLELGDKLGKKLTSIINHLSMSPRTICHCDYQLDNIFFFPDNDHTTHSLAVIDWQYISIGPGVYDVATLTGSLPSEDIGTNESELLNVYYSVLSKNHIREYSFKQCMYEYSLSMLQILSRMIVVAMIFPLTHEQKHIFFHVTFPRYCKAILDIDADRLIKL